jgi:hypothetical protein
VDEGVIDDVARCDIPVQNLGHVSGENCVGTDAKEENRVSVSSSP